MAETKATGDIDQLCINTIRTLSMDAVQAANSGHPGTPMALAPVAYTLWQEFLRFDPADPIWPNRDRFVLSVGHASMLLYSMLHLTGVKSVNKEYEILGEPAVSIDDIKNFRQLDSKTPGHPEYRLTSGVETTTGPLGQGVATSVGMAIGSKWLAAHYNTPGFDLFDFDVYALCGDGDMMEGVSSEAASLAGAPEALQPLLDLRLQPDHHRRLDRPGLHRGHRLAVRRLRLERPPRSTTPTTSEQLRGRLRLVPERQGPADVHPRPHQHRLRLVSKQDTNKAHGSPLGEDVIKAWKEKFGWTAEKFGVPDGVYEHFKEGVGKRGKAARDAWFAMLDKYRAAHPEKADELDRMQHRQLPDGWDKDLPDLPGRRQGDRRAASRRARS